MPRILPKLLFPLRSALLCVISLLATTSPAQTTINVGPGQTYTTIQSGINAAVNGDTVLAAPGTYYEHISFNNKIITVTSSGGATVTTIDGGDTAGVATVLFTGAETSSSVISGFTIRGGGDEIFSGTSFGGIYVRGTMSNSTGPYPTIKNNIITANYCHNIGVQDGTPAILNNVISGVLQNTQGTGTLASYCGPNDAIYLGGTPNFATGFPVIIGNTIENNLTGSGIHVNSAAHVLVMNNVIRNNYSRETGSAFTTENTGDNVVVQNLIYGNTSTCGGALSFNGGILVANNTIVDNVYVDLFSGSECTAIAQIYPDNYAYGESYPNRVIVNNIISGSTSYPAVNCSWYNPPSEADQPTFQNDILYNAGGPFFGSYCVDVSHKYNNIVADPQFVSPSTGDYHLKSTSPAIDSGQNTVLQTFLTMTSRNLNTDFDGNPRVQDATSKGCIIDMGAYEYPSTTNNCAPTVNETLQSSLNPSVYNQSVTFTAQLTASSGIPTGTVQFNDGTNTLAIQPISSSGAAIYTTSALTIGTHAITAVYQPTGNFPAATASLSQVVTAYPTNTTLTCSPNPINVFNTALLTAAVTSTNGTPTGSIAFTDNGTALATQALLSGTTNLTYTGSVAGTHTLTATYLPTGSFTTSSASCSEVVTALPTTSTLTVNPVTSTYGSPVTLTATVSPATLPGPSTPTGIVTFYNGAIAVGTGTLVNGVATTSLTTLPGGTYNLTCTYAGSSLYASSRCNSVPVVINAAASTLTLSSSSNPAPALSPVTLTARLTVNGQSTGAGNTIALSLNGQTVSLTTDATGSAAYTLNTLTPGSYSVVAGFATTSSLLASSASLTQVITAIPTTTILVPTPNPAYLGQLVTMVATVASPIPSTPVASGTVTFFDGSTSLGTQAVTASGTSTFATSVLAAGTHPITATFTPANTVFLASTSPVGNVVILPSGFTIALSPATITLPPGAPGTVAIQLGTVGNFSGPLALTYGTLPASATASIQPATVTLATGGTGSSSLTLNTLLKASNTAPALPGSRTLPVILTALVLWLIPSSRSQRTKLTRLLGLALLAITLQTITGCTNAWYTAKFVSPGTYQLPIIATDSNHVSQTATLTVIVTP
jgi:hypothetical protein